MPTGAELIDWRCRGCTIGALAYSVLSGVGDAPRIERNGDTVVAELWELTRDALIRQAEEGLDPQSHPPRLGMWAAGDGHGSGWWGEHHTPLDLASWATPYERV